MNGKGIGIFDTSKGNGLATFNVTHPPYKSAKASFVGALEFSVRIYGRELADGVDVRLRVVLGGRCPSADDRGNGIDWWAFLQIIEDDDKASTQAHFERREFFESWVCLWVSLTLPIVTLANVQRIVVSDSACHHKN